MSVDELPLVTVLGVAVRLITGAGGTTVMVTDCVALPPGPVQVSEYSVLFEIAPVDQVPLVSTLPLQPPDAVQVVAFCVVHLSVVLSPLTKVVEPALIEIVGACWITTTWASPEADPPGPLHVSAKVVLAMTLSITRVPVSACEPLHPPEASQLCAFVAFHCKVVALPTPTVVGVS